MDGTLTMNQPSDELALKKPEKAYRKLNTSKLLRETMTLHILSTKTAAQEGRLAWVTSGFPVEIPVALNVVAAYPEQYGAIVGSEKCGPTLCGFAEELGFSQELCSYARSSIGSVQRPNESPLTGLPIPQSLLACNNICGTVLRWYEAVSQMTGAPVYLVDTPPLEGDQSDYHLEYVKTKLEGLIEFLSQTYNQPYDEKKLEETAELSNTAVSLWTKALEACKHSPSPLNCADRFLSMAPIVALRGTPQAINFYQAFEAEVADRVKQGIGAITEERVRLLWDNIPPWFTIYNFFNSLAKEGVVFPADSYTHAWSAVIPQGPLLESIAQVYSSVYLNKGLTAKIDKMASLIKDYKLDGFVLFSVRSCKRYSLGQMVTKEELTRRTGVPGVIIEGDMVDSQQYNEAQAETRVEALVEMIL
jgi:benzoyl-CoA reductase/2-hydroxyglutaryl-CoA dehydratase subunit BcrC/BadD/HgdB